MTEYRVVVQPEAERNTTAIYDWIFARSADGAGQWYRALKVAIDRMRKQPQRFAIARESRRFDFEVRELLFKTRRGRPYRILFTIRDREVHVLYIRGPGQDWVAEAD